MEQWSGQAKVPDLWKKMEKENKEKHWVHLGPTRTVPIGAAFSSQKFESVIRSSAPMRLLGSKASKTSKAILWELTEGQQQLEPGYGQAVPGYGMLRPPMAHCLPLGSLGVARLVTHRIPSSPWRLRRRKAKCMRCMRS